MRFAQTQPKLYVNFSFSSADNKQTSNVVHTESIASLASVCIVRANIGNFRCEFSYFGISAPLAARFQSFQMSELQNAREATVVNANIVVSQPNVFLATAAFKYRSHSLVYLT